MRTAIRILLGLPVPRGEFEGTLGEKRVYEFALRQWRAAGYKLRAEKFLSRTFGANVRRAAMLFAFVAVAAGCADVQSPTEPGRSRLTITPKPGACAFVVWSEPAIEEPAAWTAFKDGAQAFSGTMTTQGHTIGAANFAGRYELAVTYRGRETRGAMECGK